MRLSEDLVDRAEVAEQRGGGRAGGGDGWDGEEGRSG